MITCTKPECQTTAGCQCNRPFGVNFTWGHVKDLQTARIRELEAEITRLRSAAGSGWQIEVDDGTLILRRSSASITVCAKQATVYVASLGKIAVQAPLDADFVAVVDALVQQEGEQR